jgi:hypothetical protein
MIQTNDNGTPKSTTTNGSWIKDKVGKPLMWMAFGAIAFKILDAYTESKRARRLSQ